MMVPSPATCHQSLEVLTSGDKGLEVVAIRGRGETLKSTLVPGSGINPSALFES
jgi:hypothetical protein